MSRFNFLVEWREPSVDLVKQLMLSIYPDDSSVEMMDIVNRKAFLKRTSCDLPSNVQIDQQVSILGRKLHVVDFADDETRAVWGKKQERVFLAVSEEGFRNALGLLKQLWIKGFVLLDMRLVDLTSVGLKTWNNLKRTDQSLSPILEGLTYVMSWQGMDVANTIKANIETYAKLSNVYLSTDSFQVSQERDLFFDMESIHRFPRTALFRNSTLAIIKPHILKQDNNGNAADILEAILSAGFSITDLNLISLQQPTAAEFLEVYKTVLPDFKQMVDELASGPCIVLEVSCDGPAVALFRNWCGPYDPEMARKIRPDSLRAKFGVDISRNAIHCTDLEQDGELETKYFFKIMSM